MTVNQVPKTVRNSASLKSQKEVRFGPRHPVGGNLLGTSEIGLENLPTQVGSQAPLEHTW